MSSDILDTLRGAVAGGGLWWIFSTAVATMPAPQPMERWYGWLYNFLQRVAANHSLVVKKD